MFDEVLIKCKEVVLKGKGAHGGSGVKAIYVRREWKRDLGGSDKRIERKEGEQPQYHLNKYKFDDRLNQVIIK